jgi:hypothetical protein
MVAMVGEETVAGGRQSRILVDATVPVSIPAGEYVLDQVHVRCCSGRIYRFTQEMLPSPSARLKVEEPTGRMVLNGTTFMD